MAITKIKSHSMGWQDAVDLKGKTEDLELERLHIDLKEYHRGYTMGLAHREAQKERMAEVGFFCRND